MSSYLDLIKSYSSKDELLSEEFKPQEKNFLDLAKEYKPPTPKKTFSEKKDEAFNSFIKASANELKKGLYNIPGISKEDKEKLRKHKLLNTPEEMKEILEKYYPSEPNYINNLMERAGRNFPYLAMGGNIGQALLRSIGGGIAGETLKEAGAPEIVQTIGEAATESLPELGKKILGTKAQKPLLEFARKKGLTEGEIAPLIQGETKQKFFSKFSPKRGRTQRKLEESKEALGKIYDGLYSSEGASNKLSPDDALDFSEELYKITQELPSNIRGKLLEDLDDLRKTGYSGAGFLNINKDINHIIQEGYTQAGLLKGPITRALHIIDPNLGKEFALTNQLYGNLAVLRSRLKPSLVQDIITGARALKLIFAISTGNIPIIAESLGETAAKRFSREYLLNPRFQNLGKQILKSLNEGKIKQAKTISEKLSKDLEKKDPSTAKEIRDLDFNTLREDEK